MAKNKPNFELPEDKAARGQQAKFDFTIASRRLRNAISHSHLLSDPYYLSSDDESLLEIV
jgi:type IV secretory pathway VirB9-like protein